MTNTQEWQQENSIRSFPFSESILNFEGTDSLPKEFIIDLKFFPDRYIQSNVYLSKVEFDENTDQYTLEFKYFGDNEQIAIAGTVYRTGENNQSLVGQKIAISGSSENPYSVCVFTPGKFWDPFLSESNQTTYFWIKDVGINNSGVYSKIFNDPLASALDSSVINPGPKTIRRIFIDLPNQSIPPISSWGKEVEQKLIAGYNIKFTKDPKTSAIVINAVGGAGKGYPPAEDDLVLRKINSVTANVSGDLKLNPRDCLNKIERPNIGVDVGIPQENTENIEHTLQLFSSCLPCCGCDAYRAVSAAISKRSKLLKDICDQLSSMILANAQLYNNAVEKINENREPIVRVRNLRVYPSYFKVSVQNVCSVPVYAHIGLSIIGGNVSSQNFQIPNSEDYSEQNLIVSSFQDLPPLPPTNKDYLNQTPQIPSGTYSYFVLGVESTNQIKKPIPPGSYTDLTFVYTGGTNLDLRDTELTIRVESNGIYGGQMLSGVDLGWTGTYGCKLDIYSAKVVKDAPVLSENCGVLTLIQGYKIIELET